MFNKTNIFRNLNIKKHVVHIRCRYKRNCKNSNNMYACMSCIRNEFRKTKTGIDNYRPIIENMKFF